MKKYLSTLCVAGAIGIGFLVLLGSIDPLWLLASASLVAIDFFYVDPI